MHKVLTNIQQLIFVDEPPFDDVVFIRGRNFKKEFEEFVPEQSEEELIESRQDRTDFPETWIYEEDVIG